MSECGHDRLQRTSAATPAIATTLDPVAAAAPAAPFRRQDVGGVTAPKLPVLQAAAISPVLASAEDRMKILPEVSPGGRAHAVDAGWVLNLPRKAYAGKP